MRPIHLSMTAFGPFAGQEDIDFESFGDSPLFLINGPTGSGKTTILDAICFALYGKSTGDERDGSHMRCDGANPGTLTEVTFLFELAGNRYRIRRSPDQERPKARGEGTTRQGAEAQLYKLQDDGQEELLVPEKITEANRMIEGLTGLNVDQFRQVMVLPQGKFRELLMADSNDREKIFGQLFQTQIYKRLEERLKEQSLAMIRKRQQLTDNYAGILMNIGVDNDQALEAEIIQLTPQVTLALSEKELQHGRHSEATKFLERARSLEASFLELERNRSLQQELQGQLEHFQKQQKRLEADHQAQRIKPLCEEMKRRQAELRQAEIALSSANEQQKLTQKALQQAEQELAAIDALTGKRDELKATLSRLEGYQTRIEQLARALAERELAAKQLAAAQSTAQVAQQALEDISAQIADQERQVETLQAELAALGPKRLKLQETQGQLAERRQLDLLLDQQHELQAQLSAHDQALLSLQAELDAEKTALLTMELAWHQGQAALLAEQLQDETPCPVCGSTEHPAPARLADPPPSQAEVQAARQACEEAGRLVGAKTEERSLCQAALKENDKQQKGQRNKLKELCEVPANDLQAACEELAREIKALEGNAEQAESLKSRILERKGHEVAGRKQLEDGREQLTVATSRQASALEQARKAEEELPEAYRTPGSLEKELAGCTQQLAALDLQIATLRNNHGRAVQQASQADARLQAAGESAEQIAQRSEESAAQWADALDRSAFESSGSYEAALLESVESDLLKAGIRDYDGKCQKVSGAIEQLQSQLKNELRPDLEQAEKKLEETTLSSRTAVENWQSLDERLRHLQGTLQRLQGVKAELAELDQEYQVIGTLSEVVNGKNSSMISLQRFVLSVLLDDVLLVASERLKHMSKGRYQLLRKEDPTRRNRASGLDLQIEDAHFSTVRPVGTLSGGEGFMAALSLALGLSDVVQSYAGGIRLDTLFIDEGFGSLDPESLDLAIQTLVDLQSTGRMVGVISHVGELKEQMANRIDVHASRSGSRVSLVRA